MNPYGKKGSPGHQKKIVEIGADIEKRGLVAFFERAFRITGGKKQTRYADVVAYTVDNKLAEVHQIGKKLKDGRPVKRERDAIKDLEKHSGNNRIKVQFHTFAKVIIFLVTLGAISLFVFCA